MKKSITSIYFYMKDHYVRNCVVIILIHILCKCIISELYHCNRFIYLDYFFNILHTENIGKFITFLKKKMSCMCILCLVCTIET